MFSIEKTETFSKWYADLKDNQAKQRIFSRLLRVELGNLGDVKNIGDGISEMRFDVGPGYRLYYAIRGQVVIILLCGGDKSTQRRDIEKAKEMWRAIQNENK
ncbi:MAG: type II toxin-antitoxin system RelE/ParE family toxin [Fibrobacter sp.]|nr:type II toxin-antitoxin system RelE/ParE family toxin [Fibrobacter sp.]MDO4946596.1 type II toxin-antitoxin system RelE/ParE family toxin [Fibrobacter sp.]